MKKIVKWVVGGFLIYCVGIGTYIYLTDNPNKEKSFLECVGNGFGVGAENVKHEYQKAKEEGKFENAKKKIKDVTEKNNIGNLNDFKKGVNNSH